jgi:hypothetical protein
MSLKLVQQFILANKTKIQPDGSAIIEVLDKAVNGEVWLIKDVIT